MPRQRASSNASDPSLAATEDHEIQELGSMYDYLAKIILLGPSGAGKSCLLHRFLRSTFPPLTSQTIGVEFGSKIVTVGSGANRTRLKLQLWDTAGTERFRSISRSYYRGAAGALLIYDVSSFTSFGSLGTFLSDARALGSEQLSVVLVGNKVDVETSQETEGQGAGADNEGSRPSTSRTSIYTKTSVSSFPRAESNVWGGEPESFANSDADDDWDKRTERGVSIPPRTPTSVSTANSIPQTSSSAGSLNSTSTIRYTGRQSATHAPQGREVDSATASRWASSQAIPVSMEASAFSGDGVEEAFERLARMILTKIELGEIDPDNPASGIQYGDRGWGDTDGDDAASSIRGGSSTVRRRKGKNRASVGGLREWEAVFKVDGKGKRRMCC